MIEARLYEKLDEERVHCHLCAHECRIQEGHQGVCQVRENRAGTLYTLVYGQTIAQHVDPIEKKPLYHFYPGSSAFSIATPGCNFRCRWCQNWSISQLPRERRFVAGRASKPEEIVEAAQRANCTSIAYTYTEPTIFYEYAYDVSVLAREAGLKNVFVTNGFMTGEMLEAYDPYLDAANVDLKAFREETYRRYVGARLAPILEAMKKMKALGIWLEVTTLIIPGINDEDAELQDAANFIAEELGAETPWHLSRFTPMYEMSDRPPTPIATLRRAEEIGKAAGLHYVYVGNIVGESNTDCHNCGALLTRRSGFRILSNRITEEATCSNCGAGVAGVGMA